MDTYAYRAIVDVISDVTKQKKSFSNERIKFLFNLTCKIQKKGGLKIACVPSTKKKRWLVP